MLFLLQIKSDPKTGRTFRVTKKTTGSEFTIITLQSCTNKTAYLQKNRIPTISCTLRFFFNK